jgi:hypothetical protein
MYPVLCSCMYADSDVESLLKLHLTEPGVRGGVRA